MPKTKWEELYVMKNRLICLALCVVMLLSVFLTGCAKEDGDAAGEIVEKGSESAETLTLWVVTESDTTTKEFTDAATAVSNELNSITKSKFKTQLVVKFLSPAEYESVLSDTIRANENDRNTLDPNYVPPKSPVKDTSEVTGTVAEETDTNEYGMTVTKYPALKANQVDLIYIAGKDMYLEYINNGWLYQLDSDLSASAKKIKEYVSQTLLGAAKLNGGTYAIPNNNTIGEYTYMLLNKELMQSCFMDGIYNQGKIDGLFNEYIYTYLETIKGKEGVIPVNATYEQCLDLLAHYWSIDPEDYSAEEDVFSVLGYRYTDPATLSKGQTILSFDALFTDPVFNENFLKLNEYKYATGYYAASPVAFDRAAGATLVDNAAIQFVTGDFNDYQVWSREDSDYYPVIVKYPSVDVTDVYENMFGICSYTVATSRSVELLTYLNTNTTFRNILQYGVEDVHYTLAEHDGAQIVERINNDYMMDVFKTGNAFIAYPDPDANMTQEVWEIGKQQNRQALVEPLLNFDFQELAQNSLTTQTATPQVGSAGYIYSYTTGYSVEILRQNPLLNKWIAQCDQAGPGVYVYHTNKVDGQNITGKIYYYNNSISGAAVTVDSANGALTVNYTGTAGSGSEITVIDFYGRKNSSKLAWNATVNGAAAATKVTYQNSLLNFDFMNTEDYTVNFRTGLTKAMVVDNAAVWKWIEASTDTAAPYVATYKKVTGEGENAKTVYTYLFYASEISKPYNVTVQPTGDRTTLNLDIKYTTGSGASGKYALFALTVTTNATVQTVNFNLSVDGNGNPTVNASAFAADPDFGLYGNLDTELVRYFYQLNKDVKGWIDACTTIEELRALVADLKLLFTVQPQPLSGDDLTKYLGGLKTTAVKAYVESSDFNAVKFYWYLYAATSNTAVTRQEKNAKDELVDVKVNQTTQEAYYYYSSPYMIYFAWLKANGFAK